MDAALLSSSDANGLSVFHIAYRVRLGILQRDERDDKVAHSLGGEGLVLRGNIGKKGGIAQVHLVTTLLEGYAKHLLVLDGSRAVGGVDLDNIVGAFAFCLQYVEGLGGKVGGNNAVAYLALDKGGGSNVASVAQGYKVAV